MALQGIGSAPAPARKLPPGRGNASDLDPWRPSITDPWDAAKAAHLLRRAGFGGTPAEVEAAVKLGMDRTVDILLTPNTTGLQEFGSQMLPNGEVLYLTFSLADQRAQWLHEMAYTRYPLREKMALFWHDHFSVGVEAGIGVPLMLPHINIFRRHGLGSFKDMLAAVTADPAMLRWLDNYLNGAPRRNQPREINENYSRELFELYTMGVTGGYTQQDVVEAAKCLSGWTLGAYNVPRYDARYHFTGPKVVLGKTINNTDGRRDLFDLIDVILAWPKTAEFMATKIWEYFVAEQPAPALVAELAAKLRAVNFDFRAFMSVLLRSTYFYTRSPRQLVKNPVEYLVGMIRNTGLTPIMRYRVLGAAVEQMGLPLLRYATPAGLDDGLAWVYSSALITRSNFADQLTRVNPNAGFQARFDPGAEILRKNLSTDVEIVDHFLGILVDGEAPASVRSNLLRFMNNNDTGPDPWRLDQLHVNRKIRGLVHLIASLPEYHIN